MNNLPPPHPNPQNNQEPTSWNKNSPFLNLKHDFPIYTGDDMVYEWLNYVEKLFKFHQIEEHFWVEVSSFYLKKDALKWYN